jgi:hypothetical protein
MAAVLLGVAPEVGRRPTLPRQQLRGDASAPLAPSTHAARRPRRTRANASPRAVAGLPFPDITLTQGALALPIVLGARVALIGLAKMGRGVNARTH